MESNINPSSNLPMSNPSHLEEAANAESQSDIARAIKGSSAKRMRAFYEYKNIDIKAIPPLSGILKAREFDEETAIEFGKTVMRSRPNIFKLHIKLGEYSSKRRIDNGKTRMLSSDKPRFQTEFGEKLGLVLSDPYSRVTEIIYTVNSIEPGQFNTSAEVYGASEEEYKDDDKFNPTIEIEYIKQ